MRFSHLSGVVIGNNVEIGVNCVLVKGTLKYTEIQNDVVIGNLCNIGHGFLVESRTWISVGVIVGGNTTIECNSTIGLRVNVKGNIIVRENTSIGMGSVITKSARAESSYFGNSVKLIRKIKTGPAH